MSAEPITPSAMSQPAPPGLSPRLRTAAIHAEQVRHVYRFSRLSCIGTVVVAAIAVVALWPVESGRVLLIWYATLCGATLLQYTLARRFEARKVADDDTDRWGGYYTAGAALVGVLWGALGSGLYPAGSMPHEFLVMFLIGGVVVSAIVLLAP